MEFFLGTHRPHWLKLTSVPLFISHRQLRRYVGMPQALGPWALDSGGFTELSTHGRWLTSEAEYLEAIDRYAWGCGHLRWAAPQDWMCEPFILEQTGKTVAEHQELTVANFQRLRAQNPLVIPVLQGWELPDYLTCIDLYASEGIDLTTEPVVGVGSVCRRQSSSQITDIMSEMRGAGIRPHGFGVKTAGLRAYGPLLTSADSMAWSFGGRMRKPDLHPGCPKKQCQNCIEYAMAWRHRVIRREEIR